jgi:hypothetical protein
MKFKEENFLAASMSFDNLAAPARRGVNRCPPLS